MCNQSILLSLSEKDVANAITSNVKIFFDSDEVKKLYQDYFDTVFSEVENEYANANVPLVNESIIQEGKDLLLEQQCLLGFHSYTKALAKDFDFLKVTSDNLPLSKIEEIIRKRLEHDHLLKRVKIDLESEQRKEFLKEFIRILIRDTKTE